MSPKPLYVNLHTHSDYSLLDGLAKVSQLVDRAKELGMPALGLTDHGVLYGAIDFYKTAKKAGIKPIIGSEVYIAPRTRFDKVSKVDSKYYHLTLLARNQTGYKNLIKLVTAGWMEGFYYKPRIDHDLLAQHAEGLTILTGCLNGPASRAILANKLEEAERLVSFYQEIAGPDHVYLEIQDHPKLAEQQIVNKAMYELAAKHGWPLIASCDSHYVNHTDKDAHEVLLAVQSKNMDEDKRWSLKEVDLHIRPPEELAQVFKDHPEALENSLRIVEATDFEMEFGGNHLPEFPSASGLSNKDELKAICETGLIKRYGTNITPEIRERIDYELEIINKMGYESYFLIVADYINWAKEQGITVGPGRGSAAGSMIAYLTGITSLDPLAYGLLFERFLNPDRISMPDIDTDFADTDRHRVLQYIRDKYGDDRVAGIITFGTMAARAAVRDTGRALGMSYLEVDRIAKLVPPPKQGRHVPLRQLILDTPELKNIYDDEPATKKLLDLAARLEGTNRHAGQHASAFLISKDPLIETVPLQPAQKGDVAHVTQFSMYPIDELGLLKMDFLGLSNLSIMQRAVEIIEAVHEIKINVDELPLDDKQTFELLANAETTGIFQLESQGMKRYLKELKPEKFDHIIAMVALYRPGPLQFADSYIARKNGREQITYTHPLLENALKNSYGIMLYQEDVMQLAKDMAGFTGGQADTLRKAIGKKIPELMKQMRDLFVDGAVKNQVDRKLAETIFTQIEEFAAYSFNRAHSACYALIAYQTAYLKAHYPAEFMAALMTADHGDTDRLAIEIDECRRMGIEVLPPSVNESFEDFGVVKDAQTIRYGLAAIKNIGDGVARAIVKERKKQGPFESLLNFIERCGPDVTNKKAIEALAKAGALDQFAERNQILAGIDQILKIATQRRKEEASRQIGLFDVGGPIGGVETTLELPEVEAADKRQQLAWEKELLGMFLSDHPLKEFKLDLDYYVTKIRELHNDQVGKTVRVAGVITTFKKIQTKQKSSMAFAMLEDLGGSIEMVLFPRILEEFESQLKGDVLLIVDGRLSVKDDSFKLAVNRLWILKDGFDFEALPPITETKSNFRAHRSPQSDRAKKSSAPTKPFSAGPISLVITLPPKTDKQLLAKMKEVIERYPGKTPVVLKLKDRNGPRLMRTQSAVDLRGPVEAELGLLLGKRHISVAQE